jgi:hypothetical protein
MPDPMHEEAIPPDLDAVMIEREQVVGLPPRHAIVFAADCLNCRGVVIHVDVYEVVSEHGHAHLDCGAASPRQAAHSSRHTGLPRHDAPLSGGSRVISAAS